MRDIRRPDSSEPLVERLTTSRGNETGAPVFPTIMDLLIFCAAVGLSVKTRISVPASGKAVPYRIFENNQKEGYIYLVALAEKKDASALGSESEDEAALIFEEYAAAGLEEVARWLNANALDTTGVQSLITKLQMLIPASAPPVDSPNPI